MKLSEMQAAISVAALLLSPCDAKHGHSHNLEHIDSFGKRYNHNHNHNHKHRSSISSHIEDAQPSLAKRTQCEFPTDAGLVAVTPDQQNAGWAMSPNQECLPNSYCPIACPPGQVMAQWNPAATSYVFPLSLDGGLFCDENGQISKPFPNSPYCVQGTNTVGAENLCSEPVAFCQTVLPGNEAMLIPTAVETWAQLAVPGTSYWVETAAHFYINPPGVTTEEGCVWGDGSKPIGNWAPYVAGANTVANGDTYCKIGWNPIFTNSPLSSTSPNFGVKVECSGDGCNGTPCSIDPSVVGVGGVTSPDQASGAGGADFCVVTIPKGTTANIVIFPVGDSNASAGSPSSSSPTSSSAPPLPPPSSTSTPTTTATPLITSSAIESTVIGLTVIQSTAITTAAAPNTFELPHVLFQIQNVTSSTMGTGSGVIAPTNTTTSSNAAQSSPPKNSAEGTSFSSTATYLTSVLAIAVALL